MRASSLLSLVGLACLATAGELRPRDYEANDYYVLHLESSSVTPDDIAGRLGLTHEGQLGELADHHIFSGARHDEDLVHTALKARRKHKRSFGGYDVLDTVGYAQKQKLKPKMEKRGLMPPRGTPVEVRADDEPVAAALARQSEVAHALDIHDPIFPDQWHLFNNVQVGNDVNVTDVWLQGITGQNATVAIVDDGLDMYSDDLKDNYFAEGSYDFNDKTLEPKPRLSDDRHGTRCAGEVSASKNNVCGIGVAYDSKIAGIRILSKLITDADEAIAMNYAYQANQIYSCSWGPPDDGRTMDAPGILIKRAMLNAVQNGRGGKGSIYVFASGNGASNDDNCNFDGYTNSIYSITVGAVDRKGGHPYYSEKCSANLVVTYSSGAGDTIHTTDVGTNVCTDAHGGTSAAAPLAAGIFALVLGIRPDLSWRDMQYLAMMTSVPINEDVPDEWQTTSIGRKFSHTYGYGKIDSWGIVEAAKTWVNVKPQAYYFSPWIHVKQEIPQGDQGLAVSFEVTAQMLADANLARLEHVTVTMNVEHNRRGDISVDLISPDKVVSHLSTARRMDNSAEGYDDWTFMSVVHWGESGIGTWTIVIKDSEVNDHSGTFVDWHLKLWGESIDPAKAVPLPMPNETDDDDHDLIISTTTTIAGATTSVTHSAPTGSISANPTDHPDRPTKPTGTTDDGTVTTTDPATTTAAEAAETTTSSSWLPSFFPTFGVSARTQIWIYGALAIIVVFCSGLGVYFYLARRKRLRNNPRDEWEFELLEDEEAEGLNGGGMKGGQRKRRAGELYDAFAAGSEDEEELSEEDYNDDKEQRHVIGDDEEDEDDADVSDEKAGKKLLEK